MLEFSLQQMPFRFGLAEGVDPRQAPPGTLLTADNVMWKQSGRVEKRFGMGYLGASGATGGTPRLVTRGTELGVVDSSGYRSYSTTFGTWRNAGKVPNVALTWSTLLDTTAGVSTSDVGFYASGAGGFFVHAWTTGAPQTTNGTTGLYLQVLDSTTGAPVVAPIQLTTAFTVASFGVRVLIVGSTAVILTRIGTGPYSFVAYSVDLTTLAVTTIPTILKADGAALQGYAAWDACVIGSTFVLAYNRNAATIALESYNTSYTSIASGTVVDANGCQNISIDGASGEVLYVAYTRGVAAPAPLRIAINNSSTLAAVVAAATVDTPSALGGVTHVGVCRFDSTNCILSWNTSEVSGLRADSVKISSAGVIDATTRRKTFQAQITGRPFMLGGRCYEAMTLAAAGAVTTFTGWSSFLAECETDSIGARAYVPHRYIGTVDVLTGGTAPNAAPLASVPVTSATTAATSLAFQASAAQNLKNWRQGMRLVTFAIGASLPVDMWRSVSVSQEVYVAGTYLTAYDGRAPFDYGFASAPVIGSTSTSGAGGLILAGTYLYAALQEYRSNAGILHRSPTAAGASQAAAGATSSNTINVGVFNVGGKQNLATGFGQDTPLPTLLPVYRSVAGASVYQRLCYEPGYNLLAVDQTANIATLVDVRGDGSIDGLGTTLASRPALYTTGGVLDDYAPPANVTMFHHVDRLFVLAGDGRSWWFSKTFQDDLGVAPGFHPGFRVVFDDTQTGGASMDDKAIFFSPTAIAYMLGLGPERTGLNSDFTTPIHVQSDVGCTNARSIVGTPDGIMFLSARGIYLLSRGLELVWIGRPVKATLALFPNVTSAVLVAKHNQVRFTCVSTDGTMGKSLVYDYVEKQWSTFSYTLDSSASQPVVDACMWNGSYTALTAFGGVYVESATSYLDNGASWVPMTLETAWISAAGPIAFQSVRTFALHGQSYTDHGLTVQVGFDSEPAYVQSATFGATGAVTSVGVEECELSIGTRRKCNTIRFKITDATPSAPGVVGIGRGPAFDMMGLELGTKRGFKKHPATKRA